MKQTFDNDKAMFETVRDFMGNHTTETAGVTAPWASVPTVFLSDIVHPLRDCWATQILCPPSTMTNASSGSRSGFVPTAPTGGHPPRSTLKVNTRQQSCRLLDSGPTCP